MDHLAGAVWILFLLFLARSGAASEIDRVQLSGDYRSSVLGLVFRFCIGFGWNSDSVE